ncbi:MAG: MBL fold metallo-hydrolase [Methanomassiliicoccaceae archaeon]|nr:MBL fold metallo-hydrolase [Methanomassiliicoccaceae archaeon]
MNPANVLDILAAGKLVREGIAIREAHSTSTLIRSENMNIVVDTSSNFMRPAITTSLEQIGILPSEINIIVLTHSHHDHCENNNIFKKAKIYVRKEENFEAKNMIEVTEDIDITPGVKLIHTPGHTKGSMSVFVNGDRKYAIAGDAIPLEDNYRKMTPPRINYDEVTALKSIKIITDYADIIIPGHGMPFLKDGGMMK